MATDSAIQDHQAWLGYLQPDGLVVSPAALVDSQVFLDQSTLELQQRFLEFISEPDKLIVFLQFCRCFVVENRLQITDLLGFKPQSCVIFGKIW